ncbi:hypothetical protein S100390_v1c03930 [Spiroplasma sp. NBRC 100390]|uniref:HNH endonuclease n=1 Tax=unclassified Spiroplasma TaxID=2637901 RepID=UPI00089295D2|nr:MULTISPECIES: HNH endonuclease signature motif containing protein [unclassified Spiroplasma]AOX43736.1 hypothetical protein STU14_v1c03930 [Spiroplasma sp. TU-14]APE13206.1 hypothetical protein S100390_v1c03930 [Spiroplasma sp. NBRC 100390]
MKKEDEVSKWQAPGNGNIFDSLLSEKDCSKAYMTYRTIWVLKFFYEKEQVEDNKELENKLYEYLKSNFKNFEDNKSVKSHFYKPALFYGLLTKKVVENKKFLELSIDGKIFLNNYNNNKFEEAINHFIICMLRTSYPNSATKEVKDIFLFPFRIMFYLLLKRNFLTKNEVEFYLPYIKKPIDVIQFDDFIKRDDLSFKKYDKFNTWVIKSLVKTEIINLENNRYSINNNVKKFLEDTLSDSIESFFFDDLKDESYLEKKYNIKSTKVKRNKKIVDQILSKSGNKCFFDKKHYSFTSPKMDNYLEAHHIVPVSMKDSFSQDLDVEENMIAICPNCHKSFHYSINDNKIKIIDEVWKKKTSLSKLKITKNEILQIYINNLYLKSRSKISK